MGHVTCRRRLLLRTRILIGVLAVTVVAFVVFDVVAATQVRRTLVARTDATLTSVLDRVEGHVPRLVRNAEVGRTNPALEAALGAYDYLAFVPASGEPVVLAATPGIAPQLPPDLAAVAAAGGAVTVPAAEGEGPIRLQVRAVGRGQLVAGASLVDVDHTVTDLRRLIILGSLVAVVAIGFGVLLVVRRDLRPLEGMAARADRISAGDLDDRVDAGDPGTEVGRLGTALNGMLARIQAGLASRAADEEAQRRFFADASHELRTPLASIRANAELAQQGALPERAQVDEAMRRIGLEAERMSRLVDDMLRLARLEQTPEPRAQPVDAAAVVAEAVEAARTAHPDHRFELGTRDRGTVLGDPDLVRRAVDNLLANVAVHTPPGTTAVTAVTATAEGLRVSVRDDGPGVPPDRLDRIFDRFFRAGPSSRPGSGLGLSIVAEVAAMAGGSATASTVDPHGLEVTILLPTAPGGEAPASATGAGGGPVIRPG